MKKKIVIAAVAVCALGFAVYYFSKGKNEPGDIAAMSNEGVEYVKEGNYNKAIDSYNDALDMKEDPTLYYNRGVAYMNKGDNENAVKDFTKALDMQPSNISALNNRALIYRNSGKYDESIADYSAVLKIKPDFSVAWYGRGICYKMKGDIASARTDFVKAKSLGYAGAQKMIDEVGGK